MSIPTNFWLIKSHDAEVLWSAHSHSDSNHHAQYLAKFETKQSPENFKLRKN